MTTQAPSHLTNQGVAQELDTAALEAPLTEAAADALSLLDHRTRERAVPGPLLRPGHYLGIEGTVGTMFVRLDSNITHIGRGMASDVRLEDQRISRNHAIVVRHGRYARVLDNRSSNGTFVNGRRIVATNVGDGDVICVGPVALQYVKVS
jgi:hypothetical protein